VALTGRGKRSGYRILVAFKQEETAFFVYGFAKNVQANLNENEEKTYRRLAKDFLSMNANQIQNMLIKGKLFEVK
jgi:hypothetical protein